MKNYIKSLICILLSVLLTACYTTQYIALEPQYNEIWKGKTKAEILRTFGVADRIESDGEGGSILVYEKYSVTTQSSSTGSGKATAYNNTYNNSVYVNSRAQNYTRTTENRNYKEFFINKDDICYHVRTNAVETQEVYKPGQTFGAVLLTLLGCGLMIGLAVLIGS